MRIIVVGLNEQGLQRQSIAGVDCVALTSNIQEIPLDSYDAVFICSANENKYADAKFALQNKKHVLLEPPLWAGNLAQLDELEQLAATSNVAFYIAYSYRFVPDFIKTAQVLQKKQLGEIYHCRLSFASTSDLKHNGALIDLSPYLFNMLCFWFGPIIMQYNFSIVHKDKFGRQVIFADFTSRCTIEIETNFFASSNIITGDIYGARDSVHVRYDDCNAAQQDLIKSEYAYFQQLCAQNNFAADCVMDKWIYAELDRLAGEELLLA